MRRALTQVLTLTFCAVSTIYGQGNGRLQLHFIDVGQGDCIFIRNTSGQNCLIDGGGTYPGSSSSFKPENTVIPFLLDNGATSLDLAILSHPHGDHIEGLIKVVDSIHVKNLIIGPYDNANPDIERLLEICHKNNTRILQVKQGNRIVFGDAEFIILYPSDKSTIYQDSDLNDSSLVFKLVYLNTSILFTGDIQSEAESIILDSGQDIDADILKVSHHGSPYSTTLDFLKKVSPTSAIISVGKNNFGHPADPIIQRLEQNGARVFRTDKSGCITAEFNNKGYSITPSIGE
jgi:competence protein ComEC